MARSLRTAVLAGSLLAPLCLGQPRGVLAATVDGLKIHYTSTGAGPRTLVLVHGYTCDESSWSEQAPLAKEFRVVTLDLPGHGKSDSPPGEQFSMDLFARAVEAVRAEIGVGRIVLAGHSMGTPVVLRYARLYPQHTIALVFVDGVMPAANANAAKAKQTGLSMRGPEGRRKRAAQIASFFSPASTPAIQAKVRNMMLSAPESTAVGAMIAARDPAGQTPEAPKVPILGIYAGPSHVASKEAVHAHFPDAEYVAIPGTGHFLMLEKPSEFNEVLHGFLAKQNF